MPKFYILDFVTLRLIISIISSNNEFNMIYKGFEKSKNVNIPFRSNSRKKNTPEVARMTIEERCSPIFIAMEHMLEPANAMKDPMPTSILSASISVIA